MRKEIIFIHHQRKHAQHNYCSLWSSVIVMPCDEWHARGEFHMLAHDFTWRRWINKWCRTFARKLRRDANTPLHTHKHTHSFQISFISLRNPSLVEKNCLLETLISWKVGVFIHKYETPHFTATCGATRVWRDSLLQQGSAILFFQPKELKDIGLFCHEVTTPGYWSRASTLAMIRHSAGVDRPGDFLL